MSSLPDLLHQPRSHSLMLLPQLFYWVNCHYFGHSLTQVRQTFWKQPILYFGMLHPKFWKNYLFLISYDTENIYQDIMKDWPVYEENTASELTLDGTVTVLNYSLF